MPLAAEAVVGGNKGNGYGEVYGESYMKNLRQLGNQFSISIPADEKGYTGRECPYPECLGYFKIKFGTGLKGDDLPCHCPYCGHIDGQDKFFTKEQIEYAKSVALNRITGALIKDIKTLEFEHRPQRGFGIGISLKVEGLPHPIHYYREKQLETEVVCEKCTLEYTIYGVFGFCPDCGVHNSLQIFNKNLDLARKMITLAASHEPTIAEQLIINALEDCVSLFDGFGREICKTHMSKAIAPEKVTTLSFQNIDRARDRVRELFSFDLSEGLLTDEWAFVIRCFPKRHLYAHKMGVADQAYIDVTGESSAILGHKIHVHADEVMKLIEILKRISVQLATKLEE